MLCFSFTHTNTRSMSLYCFLFGVFKEIMLILKLGICKSNALCEDKFQCFCMCILQIGKDGGLERISTEVSELHKSKRQLMGLVEEKDLQISEKNATIKTYLDKIVSLINSHSALYLDTKIWSYLTTQ